MTDSPQSRSRLPHWRRFLLATVALIVVGSPILFFVGAMASKKSEFLRKVDRGNEVVEAAYEYQSENGLWPQSLEDLVPKYMPALPSDPWAFVWPGYEDSSLPLLTLNGPLHMRLSYSFGCANTPGTWACRMEGDPISVHDAGAVSPPLIKSTRELKAQAMAVLKKRIAREPASNLHPEMLRRLQQGEDQGNHSY